MVKPEELKEIKQVKVTSKDNKFQMMIGSGKFSATISFDLKDAQALHKELEEWIQIASFKKASKSKKIRITV
ncbi:MAG: hypothetical protein ACRDF4_05835 [Rhabdochlamydiaceae bacterium]